MPSDVSKNRGQGEVDPLHEAACQAGEDFYLDPALGLWVTTRVAHLKRGFCCGNGCRHCPYGDPKPSGP